MRTMNALLWLPVQAAPLLLVAAGIATMFNASQLASKLLMATGALVLLPVLIAPLFAAMPTWLLVLAIPVVGYLAAAALVTTLFGYRVWVEVIARNIAPFFPHLWAASTAILALLMVFG